MNSSLTPSRRIVALAAAAALALGIAACGNSNKSSSKSTPTAPQHLVDRHVAHALPLRITVAAAVAKLGQPQRIEHNIGVLPPKHKGGKGKTVPITDYVYGVLGGKPTDSVDLTFYKGKLASVLIRTAESNAAAGAAGGGLGAGAVPPTPGTTTTAP